MVRLIIHSAIIVIFIAAMGVAGLAAAKRAHTGSWALPASNDVAWLERNLAQRIHRKPPHTIYLSRNRIQVFGGMEDSHRNRTQLIGNGQQRTLPGYTGSNRSWSRIVSCVRSKFAGFAIEVTDTRPAQPGYVMVHVGGRPHDLFGRKRGNMGGVAPYSGTVIPDAMAFVFSRALRNHRTKVCESIAHEVGHTLGLDHGYRCGDLMTYIGGCQKRRFVNANVRCGESRKRDCGNGAATQNSHSHLLSVLGPRT